MNTFVGAVFSDVVSAAEAIDRLSAIGVDIGHVNAILSPACVSLAVRTKTSLATVLAGSARSTEETRFAVAIDGEAFIAGPIAATIIDDVDYRAARAIIRGLFHTVAPDLDALDRALARGAIVIGVSTNLGGTVLVERALAASPVPAGRPLMVA